MTVIDAAVLIALLDDTDPSHRAARASFIEHADNELRLPASAYLECLVGAVRQGRSGELRDRLADLKVRVEPLTPAVAEHAAEVAARSRVGIANALVMATADVLRADSVLTADPALGDALRRR